MKRLFVALAMALALAGAADAAAILEPSAVTKNAVAVVDYSLPWGDWLAGDTIATSTWTYAAGLSGANESINQVAVTYTPAGGGGQKTAPPQTLVTTWLSGGTAGQTYMVTNKVTTAAGRTEKVSFRVTVK